MSLEGHVRNGVVEFDAAGTLPEGTAVRIEVISEPSTHGKTIRPRRQGGQYAGEIWMAPDFDEWPVEMQEAWGMKQ